METLKDTGKFISFQESIHYSASITNTGSLSSPILLLLFVKTQCSGSLVTLSDLLLFLLFDNYRKLSCFIHVLKWGYIS